MLNAHPLHLIDFADDDTTLSVPLALAGGSDNRPPSDDRPGAEIIPFPKDRVRPAGDAVRPPPGAGDDHADMEDWVNPETAGRIETGQEPRDSHGVWPAWMAKILAKKYLPPHGGRSGAPLLTA